MTNPKQCTVHHPTTGVQCGLPKNHYGQHSAGPTHPTWGMKTISKPSPVYQGEDEEGKAIWK